MKKEAGPRPVTLSGWGRHPVLDRIYLLTLYGKGVKDNLTRAELAAWRKIVEEIENG